jgi:PleD family two-component response regulator
LRASLRKSIDWGARHGVEEFVLVLPEATFNAAGRVSEKMRRTAGEIRRW